MAEKKTMTVTEINEMVERAVADIPGDEFQAFGLTHREEIGREYQLLLLLNPSFAQSFSENTLRMTAHLFIWIKWYKGDDDWRRPRKPKPEPPAPAGSGIHRILEPV